MATVNAAVLAGIVDSYSTSVRNTHDGLSASKTYRMRAWSVTLGKYVSWLTNIVDSTGVNAPPGSGTITDIVWTGNN